MDIRDPMDGAGGTLLTTMPWLLLAVAAWRTARGGAAGPEPAVAGPEPTLVPPVPIGSAGSSAPPATLPDTPSSALHDERFLMRALEAAEAGNDAVGLTRDSTALARLMLARGARPEAEALLRKAVMVARRTSLPEAHAEARIELAELARAEGDMTLACEHWQMAKLMFHETGRGGDRDRMAEIMRQHRCPTDWVLTEF